MVLDGAQTVTLHDRSEGSEAWALEAAKAFVEHSSDAVVITGPGGKMILANARTEEMFGYESGQLAGQPVEVLLPERLREVHRAHRSLYTSDPRSRPMGDALDLVGRRANGSEFPIDVSLSHFETSRGPVVTAVVRNIKERRRPDKFGLLLESAPDAVIVIGTDGKIALVNAQTERLFGYPRERLIGEAVEVLLPHRFRHAHVGQRSRYIHKPYTRSMDSGLDLYGMRADGSEFPLDISLAPVDTAEGKLVAATVRDVTDRKRLEGARDQFIHHAAHELRTPLATLAALGETLALRLGEMSPEDVADALGALRRQGQRASTLVANLLDLSQLEGGRADVGFAPVDLNKTMSRVLEGAPAPDGKTVTTDLEHFVVEADPVQLERLLTNLLTNAYRYGGNHLSVGAEHRDGDTVVSFSDDGDGVPADLVDTVFEPFVRGKKAGTVGGSGVGLALARRIVESMGGTIWYDATGPGARFNFRLREHL